MSDLPSPNPLPEGEGFPCLPLPSGEGRGEGNFFTLLGLEKNFDIDLHLLEKSYFAAQLKFHPDRLAGKPLNERSEAIAKSMQINSGYETLKSPLKRALYLLKLSGIKYDDVKPSNEILMEIMEIREAIAEAENAEKIVKIANDIEFKKASILKLLNNDFSKQDIESALSLTTKLSYISKIEEELKAKKRY
ncbi:MAG: Fe-S protein assembly co-chaperone HscB [Pseudomonadota bacterium]